jgi:protein LTV1
VHWNAGDLTPEQMATLDDELVARIKAREAVEWQARAEAARDSSDDDECVMSHFAPAPQERWDCESILTLQSDFSRQPGCIAQEERRWQRPRAAPDRSAVRLSAKTGLPLGVVGGRAQSRRGACAAEDEEGVAQGVNLGEARKRGEAGEDKKARKAAVKDAQRAARQAKKQLKKTYMQERMRAQQHSAANGATNASVLCM